MLKIDQARFDEIKVASTNLRRVLDIEEQWAAVIQNYFDLEMGLLGAATKHLIMPDTDWNSMNDSRLIFSVRLANLLSSCRSYLDQTAKNLGCIEPNLGDANTFKQGCANEYDTRFGYRFMEALRNYAQHGGLPLHISSYGIKAHDPDLLEYFVQTGIDIDELRGKKSFKQKILDEITEKNLYAEPLIKDYIAGLNAIHMTLRKILSEIVDISTKVIQSAIAQYVNSSPEKEAPLGLFAVLMGKGNSWLQTIHLGENVLQRVEILQTRHGSLERMPKSFVSGAPRPTRKGR